MQDREQGQVPKARMSRRRAVRAGTATLAAIAVPAAAVAKGGASAQEMVAGGGAVETALGLVDFGMVARVADDGSVAGSLTLADFTMPGRPIVLRSTQLNRVEAHDAARPSARRVIGWASTGGATVPFVLQIEDSGSPGSGDDAFALYVGEAAAPFVEGDEAQVCDCADVSYTLEGSVVNGDILLVAGS
jgi:hypothetical protein